MHRTRHHRQLWRSDCNWTAEEARLKYVALILPGNVRVRPIHSRLRPRRPPVLVPLTPRNARTRSARAGRGDAFPGETTSPAEARRTCPTFSRGRIGRSARLYDGFEPHPSETDVQLIFRGIYVRLSGEAIKSYDRCRDLATFLETTSVIWFMETSNYITFFKIISYYKLNNVLSLVIQTLLII